MGTEETLMRDTTVGFVFLIAVIMQLFFFAIEVRWRPIQRLLEWWTWR